MGSIRPNGLYCAYLRKSRRDVEMEALGQGETLARHEKALTDISERLGVRIARLYREIVSGDTIAERPQVRQLLDDVSAGLWDSVLVMDVDRLGRGDTIDPAPNRQIRAQFAAYVDNFVDCRAILTANDDSTLVNFWAYMNNYEE